MDKIISSQQQYGLIGFPVKHSFSGFMHNAAFSALKMDASYELFEVKPEELKGFLSTLAQKNIYGLNVTIPHKEKVIEFLDKQSFEVREIGTANTIRVTGEGKLEGFNTDYSGFCRHIEELRIHIHKVALLGAGGAAKAIAVAIALAVAGKGKIELAIYDIDRERSFALAQRLTLMKPGCIAYAVDKIEDLKIKDKDILINATPIGMEEEDPCLVKEEMLHQNLFVYDLIYNPPQTKLLTLAKNRGLRWSNGLMMLLYQGALAFKLWTQREAPEKIMLEALQKEVKKWSNL